MTTARDCKNVCILLGNTAKGLGSKRKCCCGYISIYDNKPKSCQILHLKVAATLLNGSRKDAVGA